jgi:hypothetical protein
MEDEVVNSEQVKNPSEDRHAVAAAPNPAKLAHPAVEMAKPASSIAAALEALESAK